MADVNSIDVEDDQFAYRYDTQLLIDRRDKDLDEDEIADYITDHFEGNCLIAAGDEDLIKIHFHTNEPWKVLEYCNTIGEIYDIVVEDMIRQSAGLHGWYYMLIVKSGIKSQIEHLMLNVSGVFAWLIIFDIDGIWYSLAVAEICASIISVTFLVAKKKKYNY